MKRCDNCFEVNSDGATNCVICGEVMDVPQAEADETNMSVAVSSLAAQDTAPMEQADAEEITEVPAVEDAASVPEPAGEEEPADLAEPEPAAATDWGAEEEPAAMVEPEPVAPDDFGAEEKPAEAMEPEAVAAAEPEAEQEPAEALEPEQMVAPEPEEPSVEPAAEPPVAAVPRDMPANGQAVVQVFHDTEPHIVYSHTVVNDVTLIGREDPQRDVFPDLDLGALADKGVSVTRVSRQHLRLLRQEDRYFLFVYRGSTGTQVNKDLVDESRYGKRFEIQVGDRIILGGTVRLKLAAGA